MEQGKRSKSYKDSAMFACYSFIGIIILTLLLTINAHAQVVSVTKYPHQADLLVYATPYAHQADKKVCKVKYRHKADANKNLWYFCDYPYQADMKIFFVKYRWMADMKVHFVRRVWETR